VGLLGLVGGLGGAGALMLGIDLDLLLDLRLGFNLDSLDCSAFSLACCSACCLIVLKVVSNISCNSFNCSSAFVNSNSLIQSILFLYL
jgi:hypothetical protein